MTTHDLTDRPGDDHCGSSDHVTCERCVAFLMDYLDATLDADTSARFDAHLARCPNCVTYIENYRAAVRLARAAGTDAAAQHTAPPPELVRAILRSRSPH